jgi:hypothetical protein
VPVCCALSEYGETESVASPKPDDTKTGVDKEVLPKEMKTCGTQTPVVEEVKKKMVSFGTQTLLSCIETRDAIVGPEPKRSKRFKIFQLKLLR